MKYSREIIDKIRDRADIVEVIGEDVTLKPKGSNYSGFSPFNEEKTPSFVVSPVKRIYKDFSSGKSGNVFTWLMEFHGLNFNQAIQLLAKKYSISLPDSHGDKSDDKETRIDAAYEAMRFAAEYFHKKLFEKEGKPAYSFFLNRGFSRDTMTAFMLGYAPESWDGLSNEMTKAGFTEQNMIDAGLIIKRESGGYYDRFRGRAVFTIRDYMGKPVGFGARRMNENKDEPKYINSPQSLIYDKSNVLYGLAEGKNAIRNKAEAILVEGYADVITLYQAGIQNVVAASGTALTHQQVKLLKRYTKKIFVVFDSDNAGINAAEKAAELIIENSLEPMIASLPAGEDPDSLVKESGPKSLQFYLDNTQNIVEFKIKNRKKSGNINTPAEQADFLREITKIISKIPDKLQHHFYIRRVATLMHLSELQVEQIYQEKSDYTQQIPEQVIEKVPLPSQEVNKTFVADKVFTEVTIGNTLHKIPVNFAHELTKEELIILKYLIIKDNPLFYIESKYDISTDNFISDIAKRLFTIIYETAFDNEDVFDMIISGDNLDSDIRDLMSSIALPVFETSKKWNHFSDSNDENVELLLSDSINKLQIRKHEDRIKEITEKLRDNSPSSSALLAEQVLLVQKVKELRKDELLPDDEQIPTKNIPF